LDNLELISQLAVRDGLGIILAVFIAVAFFYIVKRMLASHQTYVEALMGIIREREEGLVDHIGALSQSVGRMGSSLDKLTSTVEGFEDKLEELNKRNN